MINKTLKERYQRLIDVGFPHPTLWTEFMEDCIHEIDTQVQKGWISVEDDLPPLNEKILAFDSGGFGVLSARYSTRGWYLEGELDNFQHVTHWTHLPSPPKGVD